MRCRFIVFFLLLGLTSCSLLTKSGRQRRAYEHYLRKSIAARERQRVKFKANPSTFPLRPSEPSPITVTAQPESPESVTAAPTEPLPP